MRVRVNDADLVESLLDYLRQRISCVAARVSENEIEVSLLESFGVEAHRVELDRIVDAWSRASAGERSRSELDPGRARPLPS